MARQVNINDTLSKNITYFDSDNSTYDSVYSSINNGYSGADDDSYASFYINTGYGAET